MSMKFQRKKGRNVLLSFFYKFDKIIPLSKTRKLKLYLDLEWIFERLAHEQSFKVFDKTCHPVRTKSTSFLQKHLNSSHEVLDLGCNSGDLTFLLSKYVKTITGIDYDLKLIDQAKAKYTSSTITFIGDDALSYLKKNNKVFDVLILSHILEHLEEPGSFLRSFKKFFTNIYIEVPDFERTHLNIYRQKLQSSLVYSDIDHIWEFDRQSIQKLVIECGLVIQDAEFRLGVQKYWCSTK